MADHKGSVEMQQKQAELALYREEHRKLQSATPADQAAVLIIQYCQDNGGDGSSDPIQQDSPWKKVPGQSGCCVVS